MFLEPFKIISRKDQNNSETLQIAAMDKEERKQLKNQSNYSQWCSVFEQASHPALHQSSNSSIKLLIYAIQDFVKRCLEHRTQIFHDRSKTEDLSRQMTVYATDCQCAKIQASAKR